MIFSYVMGGSAVYEEEEEDWEITFPRNGVKTLVLVGRAGNGKSATGNTILGKQSFRSKTSCSGVTTTSELQSTVLKDGQTLNVIDTPGLFDFEAGSEFIGKEIAKCIDLAKDGIHAVVVVFSVRTRFSEEEVSALQRLRTLFGRKIVNYIIVVFTGGDGLKNYEPLDAYLGPKPPRPLKDFLTVCENRLVLFDNETKDETKRQKQVEDLLRLVDMVVEQNGGKPYTDELFVQLKREATNRGKQEEDASRKGYTLQEITELKEQMDRSHEQQLTRITEMLESKLKEATRKLEQQLAEAEAARAKAEKQARVAQKKTNDQINELRESLSKAEMLAEVAQKKSNDEIEKLRQELKKAHKETEEIRRQAAEAECLIL